jgi:cobalt-zinc-cadmium efflux system membrane fusion protein
MQGYVRSVFGLEGQRVSKGQVLVELENPDYIEVQQSYLKAKAELLQKELDYDRQSDLLKEKATTAKQAELAKAAYQIAAAEVKALEEKLAYMGFDAQQVLAGKIQSIVKLRSPFNGIVHHVAVHKGEFVETQSRIMQVIDPSHMHAELQVFQSDFPLLKVGQTFSFNVPAFGAESEPFSGKIELLGRAVEEDSKTIRVHGHFKEDDRLIPGLFIEAEIASGLVKGLALPSSAVVWQKGVAYAFAAVKSEQGFSFERKAITVGAHNDQWTELQNPSEEIIQQQWVLKGADQLQAQIDLAEGGEE